MHLSKKTTLARRVVQRWCSLMLTIPLCACGGSGSDNAPAVNSPPVDTVPPVITLIGDAVMTHEQGMAFNDPGASASDNFDGDISANIIATSNGDVNTPGTYTITYTVFDKAGNAATPVVREVNVVAPPDTTAPIMTLVGDAFMIHDIGTVFDDPGATASDDVDGTIPAIIVTGSVDVNTLGTYTLEYRAVDSAGNVAIPVMRTVEVVPLPLTLDMTPQATKIFAFAWNDVDGEDEYRLLENPDGHSGFTEIASLAAGTTEYRHSVTLYNRINAQYIVEACDNTGCTPSNTFSVTGNLATAVGDVSASNGSADDEFGFAVALSGDGSTMAVGAPYEDSSDTGVDGDQDNDNATDAGAVYVFSLDAAVWVQQAYLKASNADAGDEFGASVALSEDGDTLVVGASQESSNAIDVNGDQNDNSALSSGAVYVFTRTRLVAASISNIEWTQQAYLKASNTDAGDEFGYSVDITNNGETLAVGALEEDSGGTGTFGGDQSDNSVFASGAAYLFTRTGNDWSQRAYIKASNTDFSDRFGNTVALSGDGRTLAVGAENEKSSATGIDGDQNDDSATNSGALYVFSLDAGLWRQQAYIKASTNDDFDNFGGKSLALSDDGNTLAAGATNEDSSDTGVNGNESDDSSTNSGAVYLFTRAGSDWSQQAYIKASNTSAVDLFGRSLSLDSSGDTLVVGAYLEDSIALGINGEQGDNSGIQSGAMYVFTRGIGNIWSQHAYVKTSDRAASLGTLGFSVALSGDGNTLVSGAPGENLDTGVVHVY